MNGRRARVLATGVAGAGFVLVYLWTFPWFAPLKSANELPRLFLAQELVRHGTTRIDPRMKELGSTFDVATTPPPDKHHYSNKAPGVSLLAVPAVAVADAAGATSEPAQTWIARFFAVTLPCLAFLPFFWMLTARFAAAAAARRGALVAYALGSMALPYGILLFSHAVAAAAAGGAFACAVALVRGTPRRRSLVALACGVLAGTSMLVDYQSLLAAAIIGVYLLVRSPRRVADAALAALGAVPPIVALLAYHRAAFGSPWKTGYSFAADPAHEQGVLGIIGPNAKAMANALVAPDNGLLVLMPWVLLAVVGGVVIARSPAARARCGAEALVCGLIVLVYVLFVGSLVPEFGRAGWSVGPRYITVALPFAAWLCAAGLDAADARPATRVPAQALVLAGVVVYVVAATTFPHWPTAFSNPLHSVSFRMLREGLVPPSAGTALGLEGLASLMPALVLAAALALALLAWGRDRARWGTTAAAALLAAGLVAATASLPERAAPSKWDYVRSVVAPPRAAAPGSPPGVRDPGKAQR